VLLDDAALRGEGVLALGDPPAADPEAASVYRGGEGLAPLPASRAEAQAIGDIVLIGDAATETGLLNAVASRPRWHAVHLACHGLVRADLPELSCLALGADADNDGFLTVLEVFRTKIPADLVVLSACETAKGKVYKAEGVIGLTRAFMLAGSPRVICSLWRVDDAATRELMTAFYKEWKGGAGAAAALRKAQAHVASQEKWKDPYFWAAWQLWGLPE
jgi:CHAT domain-containing protein